MDKKLNILVAEDDYAIALALKTIIKNNFNCELTMAQNGEEAWQTLKKGDFDLIMSDWNMPIKTGCEFLADVKNDAATRHIPFIMLTARADKNSVIDAAKYGVTDYIHKPFDRKKLIEKLNSIIKTNIENKQSSQQTGNDESGGDNTATENKSQRRAIIDVIAQKLKNDDYNLPMLSDIVSTVNSMLKDNDASISEIAEVIKNDPVITTRLLALSNSAMYRGAKNQTTLEDAITRLGLKETTNYLWIFGNAGLFESDNSSFAQLLKIIRQHSMAAAEAARLIAKETHKASPDECFYMGIMHEMGALLIVRILDDIRKHENFEDESLVKQTIRKLHGQFGGILMKRWNMSDEIQVIALYHEDISQAPSVSDELRIIYIANLLANSMGYSIDKNEHENIDIAQNTVSQSLGLTKDSLQTIAQRVNEYIKEMDKMMQPSERVSLF